MSTTLSHKSPKVRKPKYAPVSEIALSSICPSPENDELYRPVDPVDSEIVELAESIRQHGILEPLDVTLDGYILSGHRRYVSAKLAGLRTVPVRYEPIRRDDDLNHFLVLLREHNRQREKTSDERLREEVVSIDPDEAYKALIEHRESVSRIETDTIEIRGHKSRDAISAAKLPFLNAVKTVIEDRRNFLPLSVRQIHYALLNDPPLIHAKKPHSIYRNDPTSYNRLIDLLTRARMEGLIRWEVIADETRPITTWAVHQSPGHFMGSELRGLLKGYYRDLLQSQPNHIELVVEKNTVASICRTVASRYCIPMTSGRGYCSSPPRRAMQKRFRNSGKSKLILLVATDFDPDGEEIAHSLARSMRDEFHVRSIEPIKVALTAEQVEQFNLPPVMQAKKGSPQYQKFADKHGDDVFELEAIDPSDLQQILTSAIDSVIYVDLFNAELEAEKHDAGYLQGVRRKVAAVLQNVESADLAERVAKEFPASRWHPKLQFEHHAAVAGLPPEVQDLFLGQCEDMVQDRGADDVLRELQIGVSEYRGANA